MKIININTNFNTYSLELDRGVRCGVVWPLRCSKASFTLG